MASEDDDTTTQQNTKEEKPDIQALTIKVRSQDGAELQFKIKSNTPLIKVFNVYCQRKGLERDELKFMFEGSLLANGDATPEEVHIEDGDIIDAMATQIGGFGATQEDQLRQ